MLIRGLSEENRYSVSGNARDYQGKGVFTWADGRRYEGEFYHGLLHGRGSFTWPDGSSYTGEWQNNLPHGKGVYVWPDGTRLDGEWEEGKAKDDEARLKAEEEGLELRKKHGSKRRKRRG